eukprot:CAMPEP_0178913966 /NCGR_PEP_ID=MMETSP0786-20121207/11144_1 /TAXON_ID=186022 /ORGANISM="Thalassionema frauenfeldii, Strain CCMP 1798" /LENGTH=237 /DNA_ID=CAMNT_0020586783 /DNA_START=68 /DNA_END=784 /DNA_ORIENTATION=-
MKIESVMSTLAPFVASAIRDKVIADMMDEIDQLKSQLRTSRQVQVTGPGGNPVYANAQLLLTNNNNNNNNNNNEIPTEKDATMSSSSTNTTTCSSSGIEMCIESFATSQIHLGGICVAEITDSSSAEAYMEEFNDDEQEANVNVYFKHGIWLSMRVSPISFEKFQQLNRRYTHDVNPEDVFEDIIYDEKSGIKTIRLDCIMFKGKSATFASFRNWAIDGNNENEEAKEETSSVHTIG